VRATLSALAAVVLLAAVATPAGAAGLPTVFQDDRLLLHQPPEQVREALEGMRALGADRVRLTANWSVLAPSPDADRRPEFDAADPAAYDQLAWRRLDQAVVLAREVGLDVVVDIGFWAPRWATTGPGPRARENVDPRAYADFATAVARRYSGSFALPADAPPPSGEQPPPPQSPPPPPPEDESLVEELIGGDPDVPRQGETPPPSVPPGEPLPAIDQFILWNEPNHPALLMPQWSGTQPASPDVYRAMVHAAYPAAKSVRPSAAVLIGNTSSTAGARDGDGPVAPLRFLRELACVDRGLRPRTDGACADFRRVPGDGWAHHPYMRNERPDRRSRGRKIDEAGVGDLARMSGLLDDLVANGRLAPGNRAIHLTEFGYETAAVGRRRALSQAEQARWINWAEWEVSRVPAVRAFAQFLLRDQPPAPQRISDSTNRPFGEFSTGLLDVDGRPKLAARAFVAGLFAELRGRSTVELWARLRLGSAPRRIWFERRLPGGTWQRLTTASRSGRRERELVIGGRDAVTRRTTHVRGARYRLVHVRDTGPVAGLPVAPIRVRRAPSVR
jgi:hypothetical protein